MRISELSRRSHVPVATIKFYIREGLLPAGRPTAATQSEYDGTHLRRLRLIRALTGVRGLSLHTARDVLAAVREYETDLHQVLGLVLGAKPATEGQRERARKRDGGAGEDGEGEPGEGGEDGGEGADGGDSSADVAALVAEMGWQVSRYAPAKAVIAETLSTMRSLGVDYTWRSLLPYARLAERTAAYDLDQLGGLGGTLEQAERAVLLTVVLEPALLALRRLAQEHESAQRHPA